jgi:hypothetical protein
MKVDSWKGGGGGGGEGEHAHSSCAHSPCMCASPFGVLAYTTSLFGVLIYTLVFTSDSKNRELLFEILNEIL